MNYIIVLLLAWSFTRLWRYGGFSRPQFMPKVGLGLLFFTNNKLYFDLKISEFSVTAACPERASRVEWVAKKISKANPFQTHPNPFFHTPIPVFGRISRIFDNFRQTFLCKAKPFFSKIQIENKGLTAVLKSKCGAL